ncbi:MAG: transporter substrate-binding domain-containing protein [Leptolyngbya sp. SIO4C1]|nr:transporter substrate-binding domain-containing protein [Leptolyngbya sp. SIO4C1]
MAWRSLLALATGLGVQLAVPSITVSAELADIRDRGYLIVAVKDSWPPLGFRNEAGELVGFEIDIARQLAQRLLGDPDAVELRPVSNRDRINRVIEGEADIAIAGVTLTSPRQRIASFSLPYYLDGVGFVTQRDRIQSLDDLQSARVALLNSSSTVTQVDYWLPLATLVPTASYAEAIALLETGQVDAFAGDVTVLSGWIQQDSRYRLLPEIISIEPLAIVIPKGTQHSPLRRAINQAVEAWYDEAWLQERAIYWGLPYRRERIELHRLLDPPDI